MKIIRKLIILILGEIETSVKPIYKSFIITGKMEKINPESV